MKKVLLIFLLLAISGCVSREVKNRVRDKHAVLYVYVGRMNSPDKNRRPMPQENEEMVKASLKDMESLDKVINNWKPSPVMKEVDLEEVLIWRK